MKRQIVFAASLMKCRSSLISLQAVLRIKTPKVIETVYYTTCGKNYIT